MYKTEHLCIMRATTPNRPEETSKVNQSGFLGGDQMSFQFLLKKNENLI